MKKIIFTNLIIFLLAINVFAQNDVNNFLDNSMKVSSDEIKNSISYHSNKINIDFDKKSVSNDINKMFNDPEFISIYNSLKNKLNSNKYSDMDNSEIKDDKAIGLILLVAAIWGANIEGISYLANYFLGWGGSWNGYDFASSLIVGSTMTMSSVLIAGYTAPVLSLVFEGATSTGGIQDYLSNELGDWLEDCIGSTTNPNNISIPQIISNIENTTSTFDNIMDPIIQELNNISGGTNTTNLESLWIDFSNETISTFDMSVYTESMEYNTDYGSSWRMLSAENSYFLSFFNLTEIPPAVVLSMTHLSSYGDNVPGNGYSPIDIYINNNIFLENYDVALAHAGSHGYETDQWQIADYLVTGDNIIYIQYGDNPYTHYWIQTLGLSQGMLFGEEPYLLLTNNTIPCPIPDIGGDYTIIVVNEGIGTLNWDTENIQEWVSVTPSNGSVVSSEIVTIQVEENNSGNGRFCGIRFFNVDNNSNSEYVDINQSGVPILEISSNNIPNPVFNEGGDFTVTIHNAGYSYAELFWNTENNNDWIILSPSSGNTYYYDNVNVSIDANDTYYNRSGYIRFYNEENEFNYVDVFVNQNGIPQPTTDWESFQKNNQNTGYIDVSLNTDLGFEWGIHTNTSNNFDNIGPLIYDNKIIFAEYSGVFCYDMQGNNLWELTSTNYEFSSYPAIRDNIIFICGEENSSLRIYAIDVNNGNILDYAGCYIGESPLIVDNAGIYVSTEQRWIYAYEYSNGNLTQKWEFDSEDYSEFIGQLLFEKSGVVLNDDENVLYANARAFNNSTDENAFYLLKIDKNNGQLINVIHYHINQGGNVSFEECITPSIYSDRIFFQKRINYSSESKIIGKDLNSGSSWSYNDFEDDQITTPIAHNNKIYFADDDGYLYCLNADNGNEIFKEHITSQDIERGLAICNNALVAISESDDVFIVNINNGNVISEVEIPSDFRASNYSAPVIAGNKIIFGNSDGDIICISNEFPPEADFYGEPTSGIAPLFVQFTDESVSGSSPITSWFWDFGDGNNSTIQNPYHMYQEPGDYSVMLTVTSNIGSDTKTRTNYISVNTPNPLTAEFTADVTSGIAPLQVQFTDLSTGNPINWQWDFEYDGNIDSYEQNPEWIYNEQGTYTVSLKVSDGVNEDTEIKENYINVYEETGFFDFGTVVNYLPENQTYGSYSITPFTLPDGQIFCRYREKYEWPIVYSKYTLLNSELSEATLGKDIINGDINTQWDFSYSMDESSINMIGLYNTGGKDPLKFVSYNIETDNMEYIGQKSWWPTGAFSDNHVNNMVKAPNGNLYIINGWRYVNWNTYKEDVYMAISTDNMQTWSNWIYGGHIGGEGLFYCPSMFADSNNNILCCLKTNWGGYWNVKFFKFSGNSNTFTQKSHIANGTDPIMFVNESTGKLTIVYNDDMGKPTVTYSNTSNTENWTTPEVIDNERENNIHGAGNSEMYGIYDKNVFYYLWTSETQQFLYQWNGDEGWINIDEVPKSYSGNYESGRVISDNNQNAIIFQTYLGSDDTHYTHVKRIQSSFIANFVADVTSGIAPLTVHFTDLSAGNAITWQWDFENDGTIDSYEQNPEWTYTEPGTYSVSLTISDGVNENTEIKEDYIIAIDTINWQCGEIFLDTRDGQIYNTVQIGEQCWMAENLNIGTMINGSQNMIDDGIIEKYCYDNDPANCETYGGLYQWDEMMQYITDTTTQGICPTDWHLPTDDEWKILEGTVDSQYGVGDPEWNGTGFRGYDAGTNLKQGGSSGYEVLMAGWYASGFFFVIGSHAYFFSSSEDSCTLAWCRDLFVGNSTVGREKVNKFYGFSVRCLLNEEATVNAGEDITICENEISQLEGYIENICEITWTTSGDGTFSDSTIAAPIYYPGVSDITNGEVELCITGTSCDQGSNITDCLILSIQKLPTVEAGPDQTITEGETALLNANADNYSSILWSTSGDGYFYDYSVLITVYFPGPLDIQNGIVILTLTAVSIPPCILYESDELTLYIESLFIPILDLGPDETVCEDTDCIAPDAYLNFFWLDWNFGEMWLGDGTVWGSAPYDCPWAACYYPGPEDIENGFVECCLELLCNENGFYGWVSDCKTFYFQYLPIVDAGEDFTICEGENYQLSGNAENYTSLLWQTSGDGTFDDDSILNTFYNPGESDITNGFTELTLIAGPIEPCVIYSSDSMLLFIDNVPFIIQDIQDIEVPLGSIAQFTILAIDADSYQWYGPSGLIPGANDPLLFFIEVGFEDSGEYYCEIYNDCGVTTSNIATLTVYEQHLVNLAEGWNGVSSWIKPYDLSIQNVFEPVEDELIILKNFSGIYYPGLNINTLVNWDPQDGYEVKFENYLILEFKGLTNDNKTVELSEGWNYLPVISECDVNVENQFSTLSSLQIIKEIAGWRVFWPVMGINNLDYLEPGNAYFIRVNSDSSITYPNCDGMKLSFTNTEKENFNFQLNKANWNIFSPTSTTHTVAIKMSLIQEIEIKTGDYIGAFDQNDNCFGICVWNNKNTNITLFGDDQTTKWKDGFSEEEVISYKLFKASTNENFSLEVEYDPTLDNSGLFHVNSLSAITKVKMSATAVSENYSGSIRIYPNPTTGIINIEGINQESVILIYNSFGEQVFNYKLNGTAKIDLSENPKGIYIIKISNSKEIYFQKLIMN